MVRSTTARAAVRPCRQTRPDVVADRGHVARVGIQTGDEPRQPLRRIHPLEAGQLGGQGLGALHLVDAVHLPQPVGVVFAAGMGDDPQDVQRDPVLRGQVRVLQRGSVALQRIERGQLPGTARLGRVIQAVVETLVAEDRRPQRIALLETLPETACQGVDRGSRPVDRGSHPCWAATLVLLGLAEQRQLLAESFDGRVKAQQRRQVGQVRRLPGHEATQVLRLDDVPVVLIEALPEQW